MRSDPTAQIDWVKKPVRDAANDVNPAAELVTKILADVRARGDAAVRDYSAQFDKSDLRDFEVAPAQRNATAPHGTEHSDQHRG